MKNPIYWECSPARYLGTYLFILAVVLLLTRVIAGRDGFVSKKIIIVSSCIYIVGMGLLYPAVRLFWSGAQDALKHKYISDTNELDSTRMLWMSSEMHTVLFLGLLGAMIWLSVYLSTGGFVSRRKGLRFTKLRKWCFVRNVVGIGFVLYCIAAPISMPLTVGLILS